jgi:predicted HicB family RNase H-like nuclease
VDLADYVFCVPRINYDIPEDVHRRAKIAAATVGVTLRELVIEALDQRASAIEREVEGQ